MTNLEKQRQVPPKMRNEIVWRRALLAAIVAVVSWAPLFAWIFLKYDLLEDLFGTPVQRYVLLGFIFTIGSVLVAWYDIRRTFFLAEYGLEVEGTVTKVGGVQKDDLIRIDYSYGFGGETYKKAESIPAGWADNHPEGSTIDLIVDPREPSRCKWRAEVLPEIETN